MKFLEEPRLPSPCPAPQAGPGDDTTAEVWPWWPVAWAHLACARDGEKCRDWGAATESLALPAVWP